MITVLKIGIECNLCHDKKVLLISRDEIINYPGARPVELEIKHTYCGNCDTTIFENDTKYIEKRIKQEIINHFLDMLVYYAIIYS